MRRRSIRRDLLLTTAALVAAAVLVAVTALAVSLPLLQSPIQLVGVVALIVAADLAVVLFSLRSLFRRSVLDPLERIGVHAEMIAGGQYDHRIPQEEGEEFDGLVRSVNTMAERLIREQETLAENIQSLDRTNQELARTTEDLVRAARMASVGTLAGGIAHEVGNPLGALRGYLDVARRRADNGGDLNEPLGAAMEEARRIDRIVRSVLDFAGPRGTRSEGNGAESDGAGASLDDTEAVDVVRAVDRAIGLLDGRGALDGVEIEREGQPGDLLAGARAQPVEQILLNLIMNAVQAVREVADPEVRVALSAQPALGARPRARRATDPPGVDYTHRRRLPLLAAGERATAPADDARDIVIVIEDNGPGIRDEDLPRLFDPFFTTRAPGEGTGLGLAVTARLVHAMGGRIDVENRAGGGARFTVRLPEWADEPSVAEVDS